MTEKINTCYVHNLYIRVREGNEKAREALIDYYFKHFPIHYYEEVELDDANIEQMFLTLYHLDFENNK